MHNPAVNPARFTAVSAGYYIVTGCVYFQASGAVSNPSWASIRQNGATNLCYQFFPFASNADRILIVAQVVKLAIGDYVELTAFQNSGFALNVGVAATNLAIQKITS